MGELQVFDAGHAICVVQVGAVDVSERVLTRRREAVIGLAVAGPVYGLTLLYGDEVPDVQGNLMVNVDNAGRLIGALTMAFEQIGCGPALTATVDRVRAELRATEAEQLRQREE